MTLYLKNVTEFDNFFNKNYHKLLREATSITKHYDYSADIVNDTYLKVRQRIWLSGFTGSHHAYCWMSIQNEWKVLCNRNKIRHFVELDVEDNGEANSNGNGNHYGKMKHNDRDHAEQVLLQQQEWNDQQEEYYQKIEFIVRILFNYIESNYNERDATLFKFYFIEGTTYKDLSRITGYSQAYISNTIKPIKKSLKHNFQQFLKQRL